MVQTNRIVFITGATSGIGKACAEKFAAAGDNIIINGRRKDRLAGLKKYLQKDFNVNDGVAMGFLRVLLLKGAEGDQL